MKRHQEHKFSSLSYEVAVTFGVFWFFFPPPDGEIDARTSQHTWPRYRQMGASSVVVLTVVLAELTFPRTMCLATVSSKSFLLFLEYL